MLLYIFSLLAAVTIISSCGDRNTSPSPPDEPTASPPPYQSLGEGRSCETADRQLARLYKPKEVELRSEAPRRKIEVRSFPTTSTCEQSANELAESLSVSAQTPFTISKFEGSARCDIELAFKKNIPIVSTMDAVVRTPEKGMFDWWGYASLAECEADLTHQKDIFVAKTTLKAEYAYCGIETTTQLKTRTATRPLPESESYFINITAIGDAQTVPRFVFLPDHVEDPAEQEYRKTYGGLSDFKKSVEGRGYTVSRYFEKPTMSEVSGLLLYSKHWPGLGDLGYETSVMNTMGYIGSKENKTLQKRLMYLAQYYNWNVHPEIIFSPALDDRQVVGFMAYQDASKDDCGTEFFDDAIYCSEEDCDAMRGATELKYERRGHNVLTSICWREWGGTWKTSVYGGG